MKEVAIKGKKSKEYKSWRKSSEKEGVSKSLCVKECENGYVIDINEYSYKEGKSYDNSKTFISTKNPLEGEMEHKEEEKEIDETKEIMEAIEALGL